MAYIVVYVELVKTSEIVGCLPLCSKISVILCLLNFFFLGNLSQMTSYNTILVVVRLHHKSLKGIYKCPCICIFVKPILLFNRFDLIYLILDKADEQNDRRLAKHIVGLHFDDPEV